MKFKFSTKFFSFLITFFVTFCTVDIEETEPIISQPWKHLQCQVHCIDCLFRNNYIKRKFSIWQHQMLFCRKVTNISSQPEGKPGRLHWLNVSFMGVGFWKSTTKLNKIAYWNMHGIKILMTGTGQMVIKVCSNMFL